MNTAQKSDHISTTRQHVTALLDAYAGLLTQYGQYNALDLGNVLQDADFIGSNEGITKADFVATYTSLLAIKAVMDAGHLTNLYKVAV